DEQIQFLVAPPLKDGEHDAFSLPEVTQNTASLYEHCARALAASRAVGVHNLPLMGGGDWNDGMNRVGQLGKGESVWLGWFLYITLATCTPHAESRKEDARAQSYREHLDHLKKALEEKGWDGDWYRRAYFDD